MNYKDINDYEILYLIKENDDDTINILYKKYEPLIINKINKYSYLIKEFNLSYDDLKQECYVRFTELVNNYNENKNCLFYSYLNLCIDGCLKNYFRHILTDKNYSNINNVSLDSSINDDGISLNEIIKGSSNNPLSIVEHFDICNSINSYIYSLSIDYASMLELHLEGYSNVEISNLLDINYSNISSIISRILKKLRKHVENNCSLVL